jgi:serine/threonine protein kinase
MTESARRSRPEATGSGPVSRKGEAASGGWSGLHSYAAATGPTVAVDVEELEGGTGAGVVPGDDGPASEPPLVGVGKFHFLERIGRGGMGEVYLALATGPTGFNKLVVVKLLREDFAANEPVRAMFLDEGRLAARLNHPNVVQTYEVGADDDKHFLVMEYLEGQPLNALMTRASSGGAAVALGAWVRVALDALAGLHYAHELCDYDGTPLNVVHRDLSPHNVFLTYDGVVKLLDFGIAKAATQSHQTQVGTIKGKPAYMPPEQLLGTPVDRRADLFVFGIVLWEMFTGTRLFTGAFSECIKRIVGGELPRVSSVVSDFDPGLDAVVARALDRDPDARYQTAQEFRDALAAAAASACAVPGPEAVGELLRATFGDEREQRRLAVQRYVGEHLRNPEAASARLGLASSRRRLPNLLPSYPSYPSYPSHPSRPASGASAPERESEGTGATVALGGSRPSATAPSAGTVVLDTLSGAIISGAPPPPPPRLTAQRAPAPSAPHWGPSGLGSADGSGSHWAMQTGAHGGSGAPWAVPTGVHGSGAHWPAPAGAHDGSGLHQAPPPVVPPSEPRTLWKGAALGAGGLAIGGALAWLLLVRLEGVRPRPVADSLPIAATVSATAPAAPVDAPPLPDAGSTAPAHGPGATSLATTATATPRGTGATNPSGTAGKGARPPAVAKGRDPGPKAPPATPPPPAVVAAPAATPAPATPVTPPSSQKPGGRTYMRNDIDK